MQRLEDGWWSARAQLYHGLHKYRFFVDGAPALDPHAPGTEQGKQNGLASVIVVI